MIGQTNKKKIIFSSLLIFVALLLTTPIHTLALQPEEVDVVIRITWFQTLWKDTDLTSAGDVYFKIIHDTETSTSGTAWNDYEDEGDFELDNDDFDGNGYYNQQYWDVDLDTGYLTWIIEAWDEDTFGDDLIFKGRLTIKDPGTTGSYSNDEVLAYYYEVWVNNVLYMENRSL